MAVVHNSGSTINALIRRDVKVLNAKRKGSLLSESLLLLTLLICDLQAVNQSD
jgi:hypothetical protein